MRWIRFVSNRGKSGKSKKKKTFSLCQINQRWQFMGRSGDTLSIVITPSYSISLWRRYCLWASAEPFWSSSPRRECLSPEHAHWRVLSAQTSLQPHVTLVLDIPELSAHRCLFPANLPLLQLSAQVERAGESHIQSSFIFSRANPIFPINGVEEGIKSVVNIDVCWPVATSLSVSDINSCIGSAGAYGMNCYCLCHVFLKLEILC